MARTAPPPRKAPPLPSGYEHRQRLAISMNGTANLITIARTKFSWKEFRFEFLFWGLILVSLPSFGFLLLRIVSRMNLP